MPPPVFPFSFLSSLASRSRVPEMLTEFVGRTQMQIPPLSSLLPYSMDGPFKQSMNFFMRLAWSSKIQLPVLIAVCFMAFDIRLQLEINIFWEANHRHNHLEDNNENARGAHVHRMEGEDMGRDDVDLETDFGSSEEGGEDSDDSVDDSQSQVSSSHSVMFIDDSDCLESDNSSDTETGNGIGGYGET